MSSAPTLRAVVARLRRECPWDRSQTLASMRPYLLEEAHELLEAMDQGDPAKIREELGDLLFVLELVALVAGLPMAEAEAGIEAKLRARHPAIFGGSPGDWESKKAEAHPERSRVEGLPASLPALVRAHRVAEKVAAVGFDWPDSAGVMAKIREEEAELAEALAAGDPAAVAHEYGDLLLATANLGRFVGVAGEDALRAANARFERRFRGVEARARAAGLPLQEAGMERLEAWWQEAKREEGGG